MVTITGLNKKNARPHFPGTEGGAHAFSLSEPKIITVTNVFLMTL